MKARSATEAASPGLGINAAPQEPAPQASNNQSHGHWGPPPAPPKPPTFTYVHDDSDTAMAELEEFFS
jgi:hypothetical protein